MGGQGSGIRYPWGKKETVEGCLILDANLWMRQGILRAGIHTTGSCTWHDSLTGELTSSIGYEVNTLHPEFAWVRLHYTRECAGERVNYNLSLTTTRPNYGG
jgi:hypothetical protein